MTNWRCEEEEKMKLIAILLSIIIMEAPSSMTSPGPFTSANALNTYSAKIYPKCPPSLHWLCRVF